MTKERHLILRQTKRTRLLTLIPKANPWRKLDQAYFEPVIKVFVGTRIGSLKMSMPILTIKL